MTQLNEMQRYQGNDREVWLFCTYKVWNCHIKAKEDGVRLEVMETTDTPEEAFLLASARFDRITNNGAPELATKQIEHAEHIGRVEFIPPAPSVTVDADNEVPF